MNKDEFNEALLIEEKIKKLEVLKTLLTDLFNNSATHSNIDTAEKLKIIYFSSNKYEVDQLDFIEFFSTSIHLLNEKINKLIIEFKEL